MAIKVFADGANLEGMLDMYENGNVQGFTTNPSLMKKGGVTDYRAFAKEVLAHITDVSVSFEVFADDVETMEVEAREIATWADNVYVKIPCVTTKGESTSELVRKLSADGIKVNVTTIFTPTQVDEMVEAVDAETPSIISLFAGRIADTGVDPIPFMTESVKKAAAKPNCEVLWASTRVSSSTFTRPRPAVARSSRCQIASWPSARTSAVTRTRSRSIPYAVLPRISPLWVSIFCPKQGYPLQRRAKSRVFSMVKTFTIWLKRGTASVLTLKRQNGGRFCFYGPLKRCGAIGRC